LRQRLDILARGIPYKVAFYHDHGTSEQFHSEIKNDLNLKRLPSGKFATNDLCCTWLFLPTTSRYRVGLLKMQAVELLNRETAA
ncbi:hypothetical protein V3F56_14215, partial [Moorellaceae bacterium AZ2]